MGAPATSADAPLPPRLRDAGRSGFVGRADESARLRAHWAAARGGEGRLVLIAGSRASARPVW